MQHYDPAYQRSSMRNFTELGAAHRVRIDSAEDAAFARAAQALDAEHADL